MVKRGSKPCPECGVDAGMSLNSARYSCDNPACSVYSFKINYFGKCYDIKYCVDVLPLNLLFSNVDKPEQECSGGGNDLSSTMNEERIVQTGGKENS